MSQKNVEVMQDRLKEILYCGLTEKVDKNRAGYLANEVETICGDLYERQHDWIISKGTAYSGVGIGHYDEKLFRMKVAILSALGFERDGATDAHLISEFEHGASFAFGDLNH